VVVAESGRDRSRLATAPRLAVWAGVAPGTDDRAGKPRAGNTRPGHRPLRAIRTPRAPAAVQTQDTDLAALDQRLAARRGQTRAISAVAHAILGRLLPRRSRQDPERERGATSGDERRRPCTVDRLTRRMAPLGDRVHLEPVAVPTV
jgi:transposase